jgi:GntR family transcriptional regulator / MocR family aminotransferase
MGASVLGPELLLTLERRRGRSLHAQLEDGLRAAIQSGALPGGLALPSTRTLSADLGVSRRLVLEAYEQLAAEGYLYTIPRGRTIVRAIEVTAVSVRRATKSPSILYDLYPGLPDLAHFPRAEWQRATAKVLREAPDSALGYPDGAGAIALRTALAAYLRRVRGVVASPERIVICSGFRQALALIVGALKRTTATPTIGLEDPGLFEGASIVEAAGGRWHAMPVDNRGLKTDMLPHTTVDAVLAMPAHQFPTGVPLAPERRAALASWTTETRLVIEDDYDAEYRYDRAALGALQGLAPNHIAYAGTVSKTLAPAVRLGWVVLPERLVEPIVNAKRLHDSGTAVLTQLAFAEMLNRGDYDRHLRKARRHYRRRRDALIHHIRRTQPDARLAGIEAGLHLLMSLPPDIDPVAITANAQRKRLGITTIDHYQLKQRSHSPAIVLGYANLPAEAAGRAARLLATAIAESRNTANTHSSHNT